MGQRRDAHRVSVGGGRNKRETDHFEDIGVQGTIILKWIFQKIWWDGVDSLICLRMGLSGGVLWTRL
jgi:hypothetical protein